MQVNEQLFRSNLSFLSADLKIRVIEAKERGWEPVLVEESPDGLPVCSLKEEFRQYRVTSIQPRIEAENWCSQLDLEDISALFLYGSGFGYPLFELLKKKQENTIVFVFEQNIALFTAMLHYFDFQPVFTTQKFIFLVGDIVDFSPEFKRVIWTDVFFHATKPLVVFTPVAQRQMKKEYAAIHQHVFEHMSLNIFYVGNDHHDTLIGLHNIIANVKEIMTNPYISCLKDSFKGFPAFIISNGPSLDNNIHHLLKINGRGLILSTESAILPLMKYEIKPDAICITERTEKTYTYHFEGRSYPDDISLLSLALIDKNVYPSFPGPRIPIFRDKESINVFINDILGDGIGINAGSNTSHLAFSLAVFLGANPIILVGQDFAFGLDGRTHSKDAVYLQEKGKEAMDRINAIPVVEVESNAGGKILSNQLWVDFKKGLEQLIAAETEKMVINATEGGAKIKGTTCDQLESVIEAFCNQTLDFRISDLIREHKEKINDRERNRKFVDFSKKIDFYIQQFRALCEKAVQGMVRSKQMAKLAEREALSQDQLEKLENTYHQNYRGFYDFMAEGLYLVFLQQVLIVWFHRINSLGLINTSDKMKSVFEMHYGLYKDLNIVCQSVAVNFEMIREKLQRYEMERSREHDVN